MRFLARVAPLSLVLLLAAAGCSDDTDPALDAGVTTDGPVTSPDQGTLTPDTGTVDRGPKPDAPLQASICGYLVDGSGKQLPSHPVIVCNEAECNTGNTGSTGSFCVSLNKATDWLFHVTETKASGKHYSDVMFPVKITADNIAKQEKVDVGKVVVPELAKTVELNVTAGGTLDLGGGVSLKVAAGSATLPPLMTKAEVGGGVVALSDAHARLKGALPGGATAELVLAIAPVGVTFSPAASYELPAGSLADGTSLAVYWVDDKVGTIKSAGEATVSGGKVKDVSGKGLTNLGWFVFAKK